MDKRYVPEELFVRGEENKKSVFLYRIIEKCTKKKRFVNKVCPFMDFIAGYTKFFLNFCHNDERKHLAFIGIVR